MRPTDDQLRRFLAGTLPDDEVEVVGRWLEHDPAAADHLAKFGPADSLAAALADRPAGAAAFARPAGYAPPAGYELNEEVGRGGMGVVFRARHTVLDRDIALKFLHDKFDPHSPSARRFIDEAKITAKLQHPGIPSVHELGRLPDGRPYLAMKLIQGRTLAELLKEKGHGSAPWLGVFENLCQAVGYAHAAGYLHRDLKPGNVMVGAFGEVQVMDWGLAKLLASRDREGAGSGRTPVAHTPGSPDPDDTRPVAEDSSAADTDRTNPLAPDDPDGTREGTVMGTPSFMAPEQARGEVDQVDRRSDVFALGAILCQLLTGKPPLSGTAGTVIADCAAGKFDAAYTRLDSCGEDRELVVLCKRCLSVDREARPTTASEVAVAVAAFRSESEARAKRAEVERAEAAIQVAEQRKRRRQFQWAAGVAGGILLAGVVGTAVGLVLAREAEKREAKRADGEEKAKIAAIKAEEEEARQRGIAQNNAKIAQDKEKIAIAARDRALEALRATTGTDVEKLLGAKKELTANEQAYLLAIAKRWQAFADQEGTDEQTRAIRGEGLYQVASLYIRLGRREEARKWHRQALDVLGPLADDYPNVPRYKWNVANTHTSIAITFTHEGRWAEAEEHSRKAVALYDQMAADFSSTPRNRSDAALGHNALAVLLARAGRTVDAIPEYKRAVEIQEKLMADFPKRADYQWHLAMTLNNLGMAFDKLKQPDEAEEQTTRSLAVLEKLATDYPAEPNYQSALAESCNSFGMLLAARKKAAAGEQYQRAIQVYEKLIADYPNVPGHRIHLGGTCCNYGDLARNDGKPAESLTWYKKGIDTLRPVAADDPRNVTAREYLLYNHSSRAETLMRLGRFADAIPDLDRAVELCPKADQPRRRLRRVVPMAKIGKLTAAVAEADELRSMPGWNGGDQFDLAIVYAYASTDNPELGDIAIELLRNAIKIGFKDPMKYLRMDRDLDRVRGRDDFQQLLIEAEKKYGPWRETLPAPRKE